MESRTDSDASITRGFHMDNYRYRFGYRYIPPESSRRSVQRTVRVPRTLRTVPYYVPRQSPSPVHAACASLASPDRVAVVVDALHMHEPIHCNIERRVAAVTLRVCVCHTGLTLRRQSERDPPRVSPVISAWPIIRRPRLCIFIERSRVVVARVKTPEREHIKRRTIDDSRKIRNAKRINIYRATDTTYHLRSAHS